MTDIATTIATVERQLAEIERSSPSFIEIRENELEIILGGNRAGLLRLALYVLDLANRNTPGAHFHLDEHTGADIADRALVLRRSLNEA